MGQYATETRMRQKNKVDRERNDNDDDGGDDDGRYGRGRRGGVAGDDDGWMGSKEKGRGGAMAAVWGRIIGGPGGL